MPSNFMKMKFQLLVELVTLISMSYSEYSNSEFSYIHHEIILHFCIHFQDYKLFHKFSVIFTCEQTCLLTSLSFKHLTPESCVFHLKRCVIPLVRRQVFGNIVNKFVSFKPSFLISNGSTLSPSIRIQFF